MQRHFAEPGQNGKAAVRRGFFDPVELDRLQAAWKQADDGPVPHGRYRCKIVTAKLRRNGAGKPQYRITLRIIRGKHRGRELPWRLNLTPAGAKVARRVLRAFGYAGELGELDGRCQFNGAKCIVALEEKEGWTNVTLIRVIGRPERRGE
jgi:hypothetical protein